MKEYTCTKCGELVTAGKPGYSLERGEDGSQRVFQTVPELCKACREKRFWRDIEGKKEDQK